MTAIISAILAIAKAIPTVDGWIQQLSVAYTTSRINSMKQENRDAVAAALNNYDQTKLEQAIGSPTAGQVSGDVGAVVIDAPPPGLPH